MNPTYPISLFIKLHHPQDNSLTLHNKENDVPRLNRKDAMALRNRAGLYIHENAAIDMYEMHMYAILRYYIHMQLAPWHIPTELLIQAILSGGIEILSVYVSPTILRFRQTLCGILREEGKKEGWKEGRKCFISQHTQHIFLRLYGFIYMAIYSDSEKKAAAATTWVFLSSKGSFICMIPQTG